MSSAVCISVVYGVGVKLGGPSPNLDLDSVQILMTV